MNKTLHARIEELGGMETISTDELEPLSGADIEKVEAVAGAKLPDDYSEFLRTYGESLFANSVVFEPASEEAVYSDKDDPSPEFHGSNVSGFFGLNEDEDESLAGLLDFYGDRIPQKVIPIADDGLGNLICLDLNETSSGKVYWWDHENEFDTEAYQEAFGKPMPEEAKYKNLYLLADSFSAFLEKLEVEPD